MALFGSGPRSNILQTVAPMYQGMVDAEKQKGLAMREAMGAFGKAIDPKTIGMRKFKQEFADADWTKPETFFRASKALAFDPPAAMDMAARGQQLQASMAPKRDMEIVERRNPKTGEMEKVAVDMASVQSGTVFGASEAKERNPLMQAQAEYTEALSVLQGQLADDLIGQEQYDLEKARLDKLAGFPTGDTNTLTTDQKNAQFLYPNDVEAQRAYVARQTAKDTASTKTAVNDILSTLDPDKYTPDSLNAFTKAAEEGTVNYSLLDSRTELSVNAEKALLTAQDATFNARKGAANSRQLASTLTTKDISSGVVARVEEAWNEFWGTQDEVSALRKEYTRIRNLEVIHSLPPGVASDRDISIIIKGFPASDTNPENLQEWLESFARVQDAEAEYQRFKSAYISRQNNSKGFLSSWDKYSQVPPEMIQKYNQSRHLEGVDEAFVKKYGFNPKGLF